MADEQTKKVEPLKPMSERDLMKLMLDIVDGRVFGSWGLRDDELPMVFMVLALGGPGMIPENTAHAYEYLDKAGPRSINGMPSFFSCHLISVEDWGKLVPLLKAEQARRKALVEGAQA